MIFKSNKQPIGILAKLEDDHEREFVWYLKEQINTVGFLGRYDVNLKKILSHFFCDKINPLLKVIIVYDKESKSFFLENPENHKVFVEGELVDKRQNLKLGSVISLGGFDFVFYPIQYYLCNAETEYDLPMDKPTVIGRQGDVEITPELKFHASEKHCSIQFDYRKNMFFIKDLGSANGTFVNGKKVGRFSKAYLKAGDKIQFAPGQYGFKEYMMFKESGRHFLKHTDLFHLPSVQKRLENEKKDKEFSALQQKFFAGMEEIFAKHGFSVLLGQEKPFKWRFGIGGGFCKFGKGYAEYCSHAYEDTRNPVCQRCFKIFVNPTSDGFLEVFDRTLKILDDNLAEFRAKTIGDAYGFTHNRCEEIIIYCNGKEDETVENAHAKALKLIDILKRGLADLEKYSDNERLRAYYSKRVTGLIYYRQGGSYHREGKNFGTALFKGERAYLFNNDADEEN